MLDIEDLKRYGKVDGGDYAFDLSVLRHSVFEPVCKTIEKAKHNIKTLEFNCGEIKRNAKMTEAQQIYFMSASKIVPNFFNRIVRVITKLASTSSVLSEVIIADMKPDQKSLSILFANLKNATTLMHLELKNLPMGDSMFKNSFRNIKGSRVPMLTFDNCKLSDDCLEVVLDFVKDSVSKWKKRRIQSINFPNNQISKYVVDSIESAIESAEEESSEYDEPDAPQSPKQQEAQQVTQVNEPEVSNSTEVSISNSIEPSSSKPHVTIMEPPLNESKPEIKSADSIQTKHNILSDPSLNNFFHSDERLPTVRFNTEKEQLQAENEKLRIQIERLKEIASAIKDEGALFIVGDGCHSVVDFLNTIEEKLEEY